ncbi:MAG: FAD-binding protein [Actinomycetota bacterium]|nr:FAD-binding protein [Actinomycetota bacterium]
MRWSNWSGLETAEARRVADPAGVDDVVAEVRRARDEGGTAKMVGTGHSFTAVAAPEHTMLRPHGMSGIVAVDREAMTVTSLAGTRLQHLNTALEGLGLSLHNMGDIAEQTLAGAISTGTHGTGGVAAGLAAQVVGLELVTGSGAVLRATPHENPDVLAVARLGLGALGIITTITFAVEPLFLLEATEQPMSWDQAMGSFDDMTAANHHVDMYWLPHTDRLLVKSNNRLGHELDQAEPLSRWRAWVDDDLLANRLLGTQIAATNLAPRVIPRANRLVAGLFSARTYSDVAHRVFTSERSIVFREMEYAVPRDVGLDVLREVRRVLERSRLRINFPIEIRAAPADDIPLSTASARDSLYLAFHTHHRADHTAYFALLEPLLQAHGGRPHWGKLHTLDAGDLAEVYPRFGEFLAMRDRLDPDRVFANAYLRRVLG